MMMNIDYKYIYEQLVCNAYLQNCNTGNEIGPEGIKHLELPATVQTVNLGCK